ncbi:SGNH hydrolase domain-containing protein [Pectobacterium phage POP72]|uniref:SGNH hydrolase domain-containing protein n=2 Tax=Axomammavirus PP1 TaxID=2733578 RepID=I7FNV3_9CAUD|nr:tail fiber protein [Pectobacterium phage PP1]AFP33710.1 SGNH hydrolase domain-containing protein [Pectobacterium phage PP1]ARB10970.1 SGNH hydrolase domain-containing protein [Pectobacterium phage POP72]
MVQRLGSSLISHKGRILSNLVDMSPTISVGDAKRLTPNEGDKILLNGLQYSFNPNLGLVDNPNSPNITTDDEIHILVNSGGHWVFDDYDKLAKMESRNYAKYLGKLRTRQNIKFATFGDSITWGYGIGGVRFDKPWPTHMVEELTSTNRQTFTVDNFAIPSDRAVTQYERTMSQASDADICTIMLGVNDAKFASDNGNDITAINGNSLYGIENYALIMRKFIAREILRGRCVVVLGTTPYVSGATTDEMGNMAEPWVARSYDSTAKSVAEEFGCAFIDTKRDIMLHFGISESMHDGIHPKEDFVPVLGKRFAAVFANQDYKNPYVLTPGSVMLPNWLMFPISSNRPLKLSELKNGSSPPFGGAADDPDAIGIKLPQDALGGKVTFAFYLDTDSLVLFPSINSAGGQYSFGLIADGGAKQPAYTSTFLSLLPDRQYISSGRSVIGSGKKNRRTESYSQIYTACYMHYTTRGWHTLSFNIGDNAGDVNIEGIVCTTYQEVKDNDIYGGVSGSVQMKTNAAPEFSGVIASVNNSDTGTYVFTLGSILSQDRYRVDIQGYDDNGVALQGRYDWKADRSFRVRFFNESGALQSPVNYIVQTIGGR